MASEWKRKKVLGVNIPGFVVNMIVEGYRPDKDTWSAGTWTFKTIEEVKAFEDKIHKVLTEVKYDFREFAKAMGMESDVYAESYEYLRVVENTANGQSWEWEKEYA